MENRISERVLAILEWPAVLAGLSSGCRTAMGKEFSAGLEPLGADEARGRIKKISEIKELAARGESMDFSGASDISRMLDIAEKGGVLGLEDLYSAARLVSSSRRIRSFLGSWKEEFAGLSDEYESIDRIEGAGDALIEAFTDTGEISHLKYPLLRRLAEELRSSRADLEKRLNRMITSPRMEKILQEKIFTTRNDRYVLLVKAGMKQKIGGTVHDVSSSGATYFVEPDEIAPLNDRLITLDRELGAETARILAELSGILGGNSGAFRQNIAALGRLDFLNAAASYSRATDSHGPEIADEFGIKLISARHPILHLMMPGKVVANDVELRRGHNCLVISGANTGGKTVLLKTIGLCALFAKFGLHAPAAPDSSIGLFDDILADIGDDQSIAQSLSTFSGQVMALNEMLERAGEGSLVIIDEIMVGTNPRQGAALAQAVLERLIETGAKIIVTTHYSELKELATRDARFRNASVSLDPDTFRPTYRLATGLPGASFALEIAGNCGIPDAIIKRSAELLDAKELSTEALLEKIQRYELQIEEEKSRHSALTGELEREKAKYEDKLRGLKRLAEQVKLGQGLDFLEELKRSRKEVADRITSLQQADLKNAGSIGEELSALQESVEQELGKIGRETLSDRYEPFDPAGTKSGDRVYIVPLGREGKLEMVDALKRKATVLFGGSIRVRYDYEDLLAPLGRTDSHERPKKKKKTEETVRFQEYVIPLTIQTSYNTIDLRGMRVDEAISYMEENFDRMSRSGITAAVVIHGHGTGALKEAVRKNLKQSLYSSDFRQGEMNEGGDGVTIVRLR
ncbi:MAG: Smr/MutS family protein [Spirochaetes bacterium]|jgi:DNA mismatch repair protein MutS2|nr:Smr/MutS family protein [Spirochaetota bacterium]